MRCGCCICRVVCFESCLLCNRQNSESESERECVRECENKRKEKKKQREREASFLYFQERVMQIRHTTFNLAPSCLPSFVFNSIPSFRPSCLRLPPQNTLDCTPLIGCDSKTSTLKLAPHPCLTIVVRIMPHHHHSLARRQPTIPQWMTKRRRTLEGKNKASHLAHTQHSLV